MWNFKFGLILTSFCLFPSSVWALGFFLQSFQLSFIPRAFGQFSLCIPEILGKHVEQLCNSCDAESFRVLLPGDENAADCFGCFLLSQLFLCRRVQKQTKGSLFKCMSFISNKNHCPFQTVSLDVQVRTYISGLVFNLNSVRSASNCSLVKVKIVYI